MSAIQRAMGMGGKLGGVLTMNPAKIRPDSPGGQLFSLGEQVAKMAAGAGGAPAAAAAGGGAAAPLMGAGSAMQRRMMF